MILNIIYGILILSILLAFARLLIGPTLPDRVVALDLMASLSVGLIATYSIDTGKALFLDVALALAMIAFLGTIAFAHSIEKGALPWAKS